MTAAGYSGTPLVRKLGVKPQARLGLINAPAGFEDYLGELPPGVSVRTRARGPLDVIVAFCGAEAELVRRLPALKAALQRPGDCGSPGPSARPASRPT